MEGMVDTVDMEDMDTMERDLLKLKLSQDLRGGYGGYGYGRGYGGYGYSRGYYGKREAEALAEADAEPGYLSRGYGYRGYGGYGYGRGYYGKREAEAEPGYLRGYGGYGYGRGYGGYGYGRGYYARGRLMLNQDILEDMVVT